MDPRIILSLDLDFFYGQVEQNLDPSLASAPFAVQQKHIVVTCNYVARALGIKKLQLISEAIKLLPDLILIDGSDLTKYRIASRKVFGFARNIIWDNKVERSGMDEFFMDVTNMIDTHIKFIGNPVQGKIWFSLSKTNPIESSESGFYYDPTQINGFSFPEKFDDIDLFSSACRRLVIASHLGQYIRSQLYEKFNFTSSVGVAHNKLLSKLMANIHKPNLQTALLPFSNGTYFDQQIVQSFLDPLKARKLPNYGAKVLNELQTFIYGIDVNDNQNYISSGLSISQVRSAVNVEIFQNLFGQNHGKVLYGLLYGLDLSPLVPTPIFPRQIGVEDSFRSCITLEEALERLFKLSQSLIRRLDAELCPISGISAQSGVMSMSSHSCQWERIPYTIRFQSRFKDCKDGVIGERHGYHHNFKRESKSIRVPCEMLPRSNKSASERSRVLFSTVMVLFKKMLLGRSFDVTLFNITVTDFEEPSSITLELREFFESSKQDEEKIDWDVVKDMPKDIQEEILLDLSKRGIKIPEEFFKKTIEEIYPLSDEIDQAMDDDNEADDLLYTEFDHCNICGRIFPVFAMEAHTRFHINHKTT